MQGPGRTGHAAPGTSTPVAPRQGPAEALTPSIEAGRIVSFPDSEPIVGANGDARREERVCDRFIFAKQSVHRADYIVGQMSTRLSPSRAAMAVVLRCPRRHEDAGPRPLVRLCRHFGASRARNVSPDLDLWWVSPQASLLRTSSGTRDRLDTRLDRAHGSNCRPPSGMRVAHVIA